MATTALFDHATGKALQSTMSLQGVARLAVCTSLPLGLFGLMNLGVAALGGMPVFFSPFGLSHSGGAVIHLVQLGLLGAAFWALTERGRAGSETFWLVSLISLYAVLPFVTPLLDALQLGLACTALWLFTLATLIRVGATSRLAGCLIAPTLALTGLSAALGLTLAAAYSPPFALLHHGNAQAPA